MDEEKLIDCVRCYPCLWQVSSKGYKDIRAKDNAWREISVQVRYLRAPSCSYLHTLISMHTRLL